MFWVILLTIVVALTVAGIYYLSRRVLKYEKIKSMAQNGKLISFLIPTLIFAVSFPIFGGLNAIIILLHLVVAVALCSLFGMLLKKKSHLAEDIIAICMTVVYIGFGWFFAHHIYDLSTEKEIGDGLRIVQIADSHLSMTLDGEKFDSLVDEIQKTNPDVLVITGDFVDDDSEREDMIAACRALGRLKTAHGIYFVFGNHDEGYFDSRNFTAQELRDNLTQNGVVILEDESILIDDKFYILGREDRSYPQRESIYSLTENLDTSKYMIVLDHQPNDYKNETHAIPP